MGSIFGCGLLPYPEGRLVEGPHIVFSGQKKPARFELADWVSLGLAGVLGGLCVGASGRQSVKL